MGSDAATWELTPAEMLDRAERNESAWYALLAEVPGEHCAELLDLGAPVPVAETDEDLVSALAARPGSAWSLGHLEAIEPRALALPIDRVRYLQALDRVAAAVAALTLNAVTALAGRESSGAYLGETHVEHEVAVARRTSSYGAGRVIELARSLATDFPGFCEALEHGDVSQAHCSVLVDKTRVVADRGLLVEIERIVLPKARRMTAGQFGREVSKAVIRVDSEAATARHRAAKDARTVTVRELEDGMGFLGVTDDWVTINALFRTVSADARSMQLERGGASATAHDSDAALGACRADALSARVLGVVGGDGTVSWAREQVPVGADLVIDLATLRGESDHPCLLDGRPIPAQIGRELARGIDRWRRVVTDPVTGHLLDYGREVYLPAALRRHIGARDAGCSAPGCTTRMAARLEMDHAVEFPEGASDVANTRCLCRSPHHQLKTAGYADITESAADGSALWSTAWGQSVRITPRPYLVDPEDHPGDPSGGPAPGPQRPVTSLGSAGDVEDGGHPAPPLPDDPPF